MHWFFCKRCQKLVNFIFVRWNVAMAWYNKWNITVYCNVYDCSYVYNCVTYSTTLLSMPDDAGCRRHNVHFSCISSRNSTKSSRWTCLLQVGNDLWCHGSWTPADRCHNYDTFAQIFPFTTSSMSSIDVQGYGPKFPKDCMWQNIINLSLINCTCANPYVHYCSAWHRYESNIIIIDYCFMLVV